MSFDTTSNIVIQDLRVAGVGKTQITVRWPTDEEWATHRKRSKLLMRQMGRSNSEMETDTSAADAKLYEAIKLNGAVPLSIGESTAVIKIIAECEVRGVTLGADDAEVQLQILTGRVKHTVRIPTMDEVRKLQRTTKYINMQYGAQQVQTNMDAAAALWDACSGRAEGYVGAVPNLHKDKVIRAVIEEIENEMRPQHDETNF